MEEQESAKSGSSEEVKGSCLNNIEIGEKDDSSTLLQLQRLSVAGMQNKKRSRSVIGLWDPGSTLSFITISLAEELKLQGRPVELEIVTVGGITTKINSKRYRWYPMVVDAMFRWSC